MTNLEHYEREIADRWMTYVNQRGQESYNECLGLAVTDVFTEDLKRLGFDKPATSISEVMYWMTREYQEPIKLKHWEKDLLDCTFNKSLDFKDYRDLLEMKHRGYFKGISNTDMKLSEILNNCEVIEK